MQRSWCIILSIVLWQTPLHLTAQQQDSSLQVFKNLFKNKPFLRLDGGYVAYQFNYRSNIDTPYVEKNIAQHNITGQLNVTLAGLPLQANFWLRQSNSHIFRDITDVQVSFNTNVFRSRMQALVSAQLLKMESKIPDSAAEKLYALKNLQLTGFKTLMQSSFSPQSIAEAHEILRVPRITWSAHLPDSVNSKREDSIKKVVAKMLASYEKTKVKYDSLQNEVDSLKKIHDEGLNKINRFRAMIKGGWKDLTDLRKHLKDYQLNDSLVPRQYRWLMGIRRFSIGRSNASYSELSAKNLAVNGINFEYNSWYYLALVAGVVNYRFRDFAVSRPNSKPQTMVMLRAGIGRLERNYFILSGWRGQKQLFARSSYNTPALVNITGFSAESRWQVSPHTWLTAEIAKSMAPDYRNVPSQGNAKLDLSDRSSQGMAFRLYTYLPRTNTRLEAFYKHTGANFQSFNSFQTNADMESWYVKAEQAFFKRAVRITAALRKNEFFNPFIVQNYKSNTVFKSISASLRLRKWPVITMAYQPMSQLTHLGDRVAENRFQSLNGTIYHLYKVSDINTASTVMLNKFYNNSNDTGFIYYNATNLYWTQQFFFKTFSTHIGASYTKNSSYLLYVLDAGIQPSLKGRGAVGVGVRVNSFNNELIKVGGYVNANTRINKKDIIYFNYEHGYLPGFAHRLVRNETASIQFVKNF
jgi:hypothetical protein